MPTKEQTTQNRPKVFKTYNEAMENLFPNIWKEEKKEDRKEKKETETMKELASSILSNF
ncbi:MAG: hypothetical protein WCX95_01415 [Candidatus Gracilibacteria bacterium]